MAANQFTQQLVSISEAAQLTGRSTDFIRDRISDGSLPAFRPIYPGAKQAQYAIRIADLNDLFRPVPTITFNPKAKALQAEVSA